MTQQAIPNIPPGDLNVFTVFYKYCNANINFYNRTAAHYNLMKLPAAYVFNRSRLQNKPQGWN